MCLPNQWCWAILATFGAPMAAAAQPGILWVQQFGTSFGEQNYALTPDGLSGVFAAGATGGELGGPDGAGYDAYLARFGPTGDRAWIVQFGTDGHDVAYATTTDGDGGVFVAGGTHGDLAGPNAGDRDAFLARYDGAGDRLWITQFGSNEWDMAYALAPDGAGGAFVAGWTYGSLFGPSAGALDAILARYDAAGNQVWALQFGEESYEGVDALAPDGAGGVFVAGGCNGDLGGPLAGLFLARYDGAGTQAWITQHGAHLDDVGALAPDGGGGVFLTATTTGSPGGPNAGGKDVYVLRCDSGGQLAWITQFGTELDDRAQALAPDAFGSVFVAGYTRGGLGGPNSGKTDAFLTRLDGGGAIAWTAQFGTIGYDEAFSLAADPQGGVYIAGHTTGDLGGPNAGEDDAFLTRFGAACYPDLAADGVLDLFDFLAFLNLFNAEDPTADCTTDGAFDLFDFLCFVNLFNAGC